MKKTLFFMVSFITIAVIILTACDSQTEAAAVQTSDVVLESINERSVAVETELASTQEQSAQAEQIEETEVTDQEVMISAETISSAVDTLNTLDGGSSREDAVSLPLAFKAYGTVRDRSESWYSFTTGEMETEYRITTVNKSPAAGPVIFFLYDEDGNQIERKGAEMDGAAATITASQLTPNTKYYIRVQRFSDRAAKSNYVIYITTTDQSMISVLKSADGESDAINNGSNQDDAVLLPLNTKRYGEAKDTSNIWLAFTTTGEDSGYRITAINKSLTAGPIIFILYDEYGNPIERNSAEIDGIASTITASSLTPNTTYYLRVQRFLDRAGTNNFMIIIRDSAYQQDGIETAGSLNDARGTSELLESIIHPGTNQDDPAYILYGYKISSKVTDTVGEWYAFTTESTTDATYTITTVDESPEAGPVLTFLYDEYGNQIERKGAEIDGVPSEITLKSLSPETIYYIRVVRFLDKAGTNNYSLFVNASIPSEEHVATVEKIEEEPPVFEVPFELDETQVHFVANEAIFIDEEAAKAALAPVAEIILAHPDHPILLAGTTAQWGDQDSSVNLSNRRAGAIKDLLVNYFGVPEGQLKTVGLGYAADPFVRGQDVDSNGNFIETEGAKNRRVIVMDAEDPIAKGLLGE